MPADDLILNVRQIASYTPAFSALPTDSALLQRGLGGPYLAISPTDFVGSVIQNGVSTAFVNLLGSSASIFWSDGAMLLWNQVGGFSFTDDLMIAGGTVTVSRDPRGQMEVATARYVDAGIAAATQVLTDSSVWTFNGRRGDIQLWRSDILAVGGAPISNPAFTGTPTVPTPARCDYSWRIPNTAWVADAINSDIRALLIGHPFVFSFNGRTGDVTLQPSDLTEAGIVTADSPAFTGVPTAPTAAHGTNTDQIATTAFVQNAIGGMDLSDFAPINSPAFNGYVTAPTPAPGTSDAQVATTAFVMNAVTAATAGVSSFNTRTGAVTLSAADITGAGGALLVSPVFTGTPQAPTATTGTSSSQIATTAFVMNELSSAAAGVTSFNTRTGAVTLSAADITGAGGALLASPALTGTPTAPTATVGTATSQIATTAFVAQALSSVTGVSSFNSRTGAVTLTQNDISAAGGALLASPTFSGVPAAPTATVGTATSQIATTSFVMEALTNAGVTSFNSRTGAVTLSAADLTGAGGALIASPTFTGVPAGPTAAVGANSTQLATTAFVQAAIAADTAGVSSFNGRTGAVTLASADITGAGGALLAGPTFTGVPSAPTAASGTNTAQLATTAFVQNAVTAASAGVISFNSRTGAVTLAANDISAAGGALLASPALTGTPTAPTASAATNTTQIATTAFVTAAISAISVPAASTTTPLMDGTAAVGNGTTWARNNHVHPTDTSRAAASALANYLPLTGGTITGNLTVNGYLASPYIQATGNGVQYTWAGNMVGLAWNGGLGVVTLMVDANNVGNIQTTASDADLKRNIAPVERDCLATLKAIALKQFDMAATRRHVDVGYIAQDVEAVMPDAVSSSFDGPLCVDLRSLCACLIGAVQQIEARLARLET